MKFSCQKCAAVLEAESKQVGQQLICQVCNEKNKVPPFGVIPGMRIGDFVTEKRLGLGGMGEVWLADQPGMQRKVALKILSPDFTRNTEFIERFMQETKLAGKLIHPNIVTAHHGGEDNNIRYLAMSYVDGLELDELQRTEGIMNESQALPIILDIAQALNYAWDKFQILHRDIKPGNIMIDSDGTAMLMDMGISKSLMEDISMTMTGMMVGTPAYISPEQAKGEKDIDFRSDQYSLGATLYFMVTGELPFEAETAMGTVTKHITEDLPDCQELNPSISNSCKNIIEKMMAKNKEDRYSSWDRLVDDIENLLKNKKTEISFCCSKCSTPLSIEVDFINEKVTCPNCETELKVPNFGIVPGMKVGDFVVERKLGVGGMGEVWLADQPAMQRKIALKIPSPELSENFDFTQRFMREAKMAGKLIHPNIITAHHAGVDDGIRYLAISYIDGYVLEDVMNIEPKMNEQKALTIVRDISLALQYAWEKFHMLHRDIKPDNIMMDKDDNAMLMDMGISKITTENASLTSTGTMIGTPAYISPEQAKGEQNIDFRADLYSLGATLFHMVTGKLPFDADSSMELVTKHINTPLVDCRSINPNISPGCKKLIDRMMKKDPDSRYHTWTEFLEDVDKLLENHESVQPARKSHMLAIILGAVAVIALIAGGIFLMISQYKPEEENSGDTVNNEQKNQPPPPLPPPQKQDLEKIKKMAVDWALAEESIKTPPIDYDNSIAKYQAVLNEYPDSEYSEKAKLKIKLLIRERKLAIAEYIKQLEDKARTELEKNNYNQALSTLKNPEGKFPKETAGSWETLIKEITEKKKAYEANIRPPPDPKPEGPKINQEKQLLSSVSKSLLLGKTDDAKTLYEQSPVKNRYPQIPATLAGLSNLSKIIYSQLQKEIGRKIDIQDNNEKVSYPIKKVAKGYIYLTIKRDRVTTVKRYSLRSLPFEQKVILLEKGGIDPVALAVLKTHYFFKKGNLGQSRRETDNAKYLAESLQNAITEISSIEAAEKLQQILAKMGFYDNPINHERVITGLKTFELDGNKSKQLLLEIQEFTNTPIASEYVLTEKGFIKQIISALKKQIKPSKSQLFQDLQKRFGTNDKVTKQLLPVITWFKQELEKSVKAGENPLYLGPEIKSKIRNILTPDKAPLMGKYIEEEMAKYGYSMPSPPDRDRPPPHPPHR